ncbi:MAG: Gfo/Idh/MocA family oxidoreductase [Candidatus Borkfalkiaceae bacterium]|nr:Gfo/Idh/MocA family oxidoreductase [Christensenellaceae bacterium]
MQNKKIEKIKLGFIGLGQRGPGLASNVLNNFKDVDIVAVCDVYADRVDAEAEKVKNSRGYEPKKYTDYNDLLNDENVNVVIISASWEAHIPLAIASMKAKKITALEVGGAYALDDCYKLVKAYEETKTPFMFLENCCYGKKELLVTSLVRKNKMGEVTYCSGAYGHDLRGEICGGLKNRHYRLRNYLIRNCDNYPTHELGPIAKLLNINRGNRMLSLVSMSSKARGLHEYVQDKPEYEFLKDKHFMQGDVVQTLITCADGTLISLKLDTTQPRAYSREFAVRGTKGYYSELGNTLLIEGDDYNHEHDVEEYINNVNKYDEYLPQIWKDITPEKIEAGHGGMDTLMFESFFEAVKNGDEMPIDVYDAAAWMAITCLSESSISRGGVPVEIPDFTDGEWIMREPKDVCDLK